MQVLLPALPPPFGGVLFVLLIAGGVWYLIRRWRDSRRGWSYESSWQRRAFHSEFFYGERQAQSRPPPFDANAFETDAAEAAYSQRSREVALALLTLGLRRGASDAEIRAAYRKQAKVFHPDRLSATASETERTAAEENMKAINAAYRILSGK